MYLNGQSCMVCNYITLIFAQVMRAAFDDIDADGGGMILFGTPSHSLPFPLLRWSALFTLRASMHDW